jgi:stalled ribosome rescue protein Dom34
MAAYVVWMDHEHAKLFKFAPGVKPVPHTIKHHGNDHHTHGKKENTGAEHGAYFHEVAQALKDSSEVLLVGPGLAKDHFKKHLDSHHHQELAKKILGSEAMDHPTDGQILAHARKFFKAKDLFTDTI